MIFNIEHHKTVGHHNSLSLSCMGITHIKRPGGQKSWGAKDRGAKDQGVKDLGGKRLGGKRPGGKRLGGKRPGGKGSGGKGRGGKGPGGKSPVTDNYVGLKTFLTLTNSQIAPLTYTPYCLVFQNSTCKYCLSMHKNCINMYFQRYGKTGTSLLVIRVTSPAL